MNIKYSLLLIATFFFRFSYGQYIEPAQAYNMMDRQNNAEKYYVISNYKVIGSPYLFGGNQIGNIYASFEKGTDIKMSYNTYLQSVEFSSGQQTLTKDISDLDSFELKSDGNNIIESMFFVNPKFINSTDKNFFQLVSKGAKFNLYKKYSGSLDIVTTNYVQSNLRQFVMAVDYFYLDVKSARLTKLKVTKRGLAKEFISKTEVSTFLETANLNTNTDNALKSLFVFLNQH